MADEQSPNGEGDEIQTNIVSGESQPNHSGTKDDILQKVQQLMYQDKTAAITEVVHLTLIGIKQQREIGLLHKTLKQELEEKEMMQNICLSQQECESALQAMVQQRNSLGNKLNGVCEDIRARLQLFYKIRSQLKNDIGASRAARERLIKYLNEMKEKAKKKSTEYESLVDRYNTCKKELTARIEQLQGQNDAERASHVEATTGYEAKVQEGEAKVVELTEELAGMKEAICKLQTEKDQSAKQFEQCKLSIEQELSDLQREMDGLEQELKKRDDELFRAHHEKQCQLEDETKTLGNEIRILQEKLQDLTEVNERLKGLEEQRKKETQQPISKGGVLGAKGAHKSKMQSSFIPDTHFDINSIMSSFHYDNEMSTLMSPPSNEKFAQRKK